MYVNPDLRNETSISAAQSEVTFDVMRVLFPIFIEGFQMHI